MQVFLGPTLVDVLSRKQVKRICKLYPFSLLSRYVKELKIPVTAFTIPVSAEDLGCEIRDTLHGVMGFKQTDRMTMLRKEVCVYLGLPCSDGSFGPKMLPFVVRMEIARIFAYNIRSRKQSQLPQELIRQLDGALNFARGVIKVNGVIKVDHPKSNRVTLTANEQFEILIQELRHVYKTFERDGTYDPSQPRKEC